MQIYLLLTEKCNLGCKMCIRGDKNKNELSLLNLQNLSCIEELFNHDIVITGGEPSLCRDFSDIVNYFSQNAKSVSICTNGINNFYINQDFFKPNVNIQISIDGRQEDHDNIRGEGTYKRIFDTISKLETLQIPYTIATVANRKNVKGMYQLADQLGQLKNMRYWNISYEMPFGYASFSDMMSTEEWNSFVEDMLDYVPFKMKIRKLFPFDLFDENRDKLDLLFKNRICSNCGSGNQKIYIYPDLTVYPCTCLTDFPLGNLKMSTLSDMMNTMVYKKFSEYHVLADSKCSKCEYLKYCNGGCIGMSYNYYKKLGMGDIRCPKNRES